MITSFISLAIISTMMLCFKQTQWLGFLGAAILGLMFPMTTAATGCLVAGAFYWFNRRKR